MRAARRLCTALLLLSSWLVAGDALAVPAVFQGDPVDPLGKTYVMLPGVPLVQPGEDEQWATDDDVIDPGTIGDVDVVLRTGNTYTPGSGVIPPAATLALAPVVAAGGTTLQATGNEAAYQLIVSDGAASPATGNPLTNTDLNGRGALILAYADLDGDGFLGATTLDPEGSADDAVELQEALTPIGQRLGVMSAGLAAGPLAIASGLPASMGGLGVVVVGGAITGASSPLFLDGQWIATLLPCMWPIDVTRVVGNNPGLPDPLGLVDVEFELEDFYCPAPNDPVLGTPYAIPLDGSSVTTDLLRAESGAATAPGLARPIIAAGFVAASLRRLTPVVSSLGVRAVVEPAHALALGDDGPGGSQAQLVVFPADKLGNQADVPFGGSELALEVSPNLRIVSPDTDSDPQHETVAFSSTGFATVTLDDAGVAGDGGASGHVVASLDGNPGGAVRVTFGGAPTSAALTSAKALLRHAKLEATDRFSLVASFAGTPALGFAVRDLVVTILDNGAPVLTRTIPAGALTANGAGTAFRYRDPKGVTSTRIGSLSIRRQASTGTYTLRTLVKALDLSDVDADVRDITVIVTVGSSSFADDLDCGSNASGSTTTCAR